jgi:NAD(P)H-dependent flavin oxidoreductase YrpB (nitropropane dioxygenase family)
VAGSDLLARLGVEVPVVQAGMGGGLASHELAAAVSEAGGLGTIGILDPAALREELASGRRLTGRPLAVNLIVPFARRGHWEAAAAADAVVTHWEARPRRRTPTVWIHTVGSAAEARAAIAAGADAVIAQGVEAGGHVRGTVRALDLLERVRAVAPPDFPVLMAGGIADQADVRTALEASAAAAIAGTRFLASEESRAHPDYKRRLVEGDETVLTELFGMGWPRAPHRVLHNEATRRWLKDDPRGPTAIRALHLVLARSRASPRSPCSSGSRGESARHRRTSRRRRRPTTCRAPRWRPTRCTPAAPSRASTTCLRRASSCASWRLE